MRIYIIFYILAPLFFVNASDIDFEKFLNSISLRYENQLAKCFEHDVDVLTKNMKNDIKSENKKQNTIWNIYVQKIRDAKPDYQQILDIIKEKKYIETDVTTRIVRNYIEEKNLEVCLENHIIKTIVDYVGVFPEEVDIWLRKGIPLGAKDRIQIIRNFNETMKNLLADAAAFYFLYGAQKYMVLIKKNIILPPVKKMKAINNVDQSNFVNQIITQIQREPSTISPQIRKKFQEVFLNQLEKNMLKVESSFEEFKINYFDDGSCFGIIEYHYILILLADTITTKFGDNDYASFLLSISFRYEKPLALSFEHYLIVLTQNMKKDLILEPNMEQNTIWKNYVKKIKSIQPNYKKILDIIKIKKYTKTDVKARIVQKYFQEKQSIFDEFSLDKHIIKNIVRHGSFTTRIVRKYITEETISKFCLDKNIIQNIADFVGSFPKEVDNIWLNERVPLGPTEIQEQFIENFNKIIENILADAAAFYFLYGPQNFMKSIENRIISEDDPMNDLEMIAADDVTYCVNKIIEELPQIRHNSTPDRMLFKKKLKNIVLKTQTSLTNFELRIYDNKF